jgi:penicillin-binding protein 1A
LALKIIGAIAVCILLFIATVYVGLWGALPKSEDLQEISQHKATEVYDRNGELLGKYYVHDRQPVPLSKIPTHVTEALLATEDIRFYEHSGIDSRSLLRVFFKTLLLQDAQSGGGSTLTQQLAKNLFRRKNYGPFTLPVAKTKEMIIAKRLERLYSKDELLSLYLNTVPFSGNTYGIESASLKFFNKTSDQLSLTEGATLVGTLKATSSYNPHRHPERSLQRRNVVLQQMRRYGFIDHETLERALTDSLHLRFGQFDEQQGIAPYFRETLRLHLLKWIDTQREAGMEYNLYTSGLKIYTTIDKTLQMYAEEAVAEKLQLLQQQFEKEYGDMAPWRRDGPIFQSALEKLPAYRKLKVAGLSEDTILDSLRIKMPMRLFEHDGTKEKMASTLDSLEHYLKFLSAGMLAIDPTNGAVRTWVGGIDYTHFKYDHIAKNRRQVGSTFKPIVYATALESGIAPCDYFPVREVAYSNMEGWSPSNSGEQDEPYMNVSMEAALSRSLNTVSVKILEEAGISNTLEMAKTLGIESDLPSVPSLALGTGEITIPELAGAYAAFVNGATAVTPHYLLRIENDEGEPLEIFEPEVSEQPAFSETTRQLMLEMLQTVVTQGTAKRLKTTYGLPNDLAGKTGTTQANKDAWFVGITPQIVSVTWVGHNDHRIGFKSTAIGQGAHAALPIFAEWLQKANKDPQFAQWTQTSFPSPTESVTRLLDCEPTKRDGFFKRLFTNPKRKKKRDFKSKN